MSIEFPCSSQSGVDSSVFSGLLERGDRHGRHDSSISPFSTSSWRDLAASLKQIDQTIGHGQSPHIDQAQTMRFDQAQAPGPSGQDHGRERVLSVSPTQILPNEVYDLQGSHDLQQSVRRSLRLLEENTPNDARGVSPEIVPEEAVLRIAQGMHGVRDRLAPGAAQPLMQVGLGDEIFRHAQRMFPNDPIRQRAEIGTQLELLGRSINAELERMGSPIRVGPIRAAVDQGGNSFFALPVRHNGTETNLLRFPPIISPAEMQRRRDNAPRIV